MANTATKRRTIKFNLFDRMMAEHVEMPGFPQIIVTRGFCYQWLKACGWNPQERGFGGLDYTVFARKAVDAPLYDEQLRDSLLAQVRDGYVREQKAPSSVRTTEQQGEGR